MSDRDRVLRSHLRLLTSRFVFVWFFFSEMHISTPHVLLAERLFSSATGVACPPDFPCLILWQDFKILNCGDTFRTEGSEEFLKL